MKLSLHYCDSLNLLLFRLKNEPKIAKLGYFATPDFQSTIKTEPFTGKVYYIQSSLDDLDATYQKIKLSLKSCRETQPLNNNIKPVFGTKYFIYVIIGKQEHKSKKKPEINRVEKQEIRAWMREKKDFIQEKSHSQCLI